MDILISISAKVAEYTVAPIGRQLGYLVFYSANFNKLNAHVKDLEDARDEIKHRIEEERRNGKIIEPNVQTWLENVDKVIEEVNKLQEDPCHAKTGCSRWSFPNLISRHQLSRKATKMDIAINEVLEKKKFEQVSYLPALDEVSSILLTRGMYDFVSRKQIKENIMQTLKNPEISMIGLFGFGGVGKTTLVKEVAQISKQDKIFDEVVMATVSKTPDIKTIQGEIADKLGLQFKEETVRGRALRLSERIKTEKSILIILDDIWKRLDLEMVGIPLTEKHTNCKLLMTSRSSDVLQQMEVKQSFQLEVLNGEETESLFKVMAGDLDDGLIEIASQVANKCAGLPVLIVTMARSLMNKDIHAWKDALTLLERSNNEEMEQITYSALELTYNMLKGYQMKKFFLLCATGGVKPLISDLFKYGIGLGIFDNNNTLEQARNRLYTMISALKASCLLLEEDTSTMIRMHDVVRDVAISIASRDEHMFIKKHHELNEWPTMDFLRKCSQIILRSCQISKLPEKLECPNLELFYLGSNDFSLELDDSIFEGMENIKVVDLTGMNLPLLPTSFHFLTSLQTLCLDQCILENLDAIGSLKNLQILSLIHSSMRQLPSEIGKLTHLRMLDLSNSGIEVISPGIISSLINLEELYMGNTSINWEVENLDTQNGNASLAELRNLSKLTTLELQVRESWMLPRDLMFEKLERYKIVIGDVWEWSDIDDVMLKTLKLKLGTNFYLEHGIKALIKRVENLYLDEVEGISNVLYQLNGEGFPQLKHLHIQNNSKIKHIIDSMNRNEAQLFPKLETLVVQNLCALDKIYLDPLPNNSFTKIRLIKVQNCNELKYLLSSSMVEGLPQLLEIEVCQCNFMEKIVSANSGANVDKIEFLSLKSLTLQRLQTLDSFFSHSLTSLESDSQRTEIDMPTPFFNAQIAFSNLNTLKLSSLNLNKIWEENQHSFQKLTTLIVESCGELKYLFSSLMVESFPNLIRLEICDCSLMEDIISTKETSHGIAASGEVQFSKLETIILKDMKNLKTIWHDQFGKLKTLQVKNCEKIMVIFPSSMQNTYLNLETLEVSDCALVEEIFTFKSDEICNVEDATQLKTIILERLPKLKQTWSSDSKGILSFNNLENVRVEYCGNLLYLFPLSIATSCSYLKELDISHCINLEKIITQKETSICTFEFNKLNTLVLLNLPRLKGLCADNHTLSCSSLMILKVVECPRLNLLRTQSTSNNEGFLDDKFNISVQQSLLIVDQVIPNLKTLCVDQYHADKILQGQNIGDLFSKISQLELHLYENEDSIFPDWFLQNAYVLKVLTIGFSSFKKIFQDERRISNGKRCIKLEYLELHGLSKLHHLCEEGFQLDPVLMFVENLYISECSSMINMVPSSARFSHLIYLEIVNCNGMINLISSPTGLSLTKLTSMTIKGCNSLQEIIAENGDHIVYDISFLSLEVLRLECLPKLERFCSSKCGLRFPSLNEVVVKQCPHMKYFSEGHISMPKVRKVMTEENNKEWYWKGDLNSTIQNMFEDKVAFYRIEDLTMCEFPELKDIWYGQLHPKMFGNLKYMVVHKCDFLLDNLFSLNTLQVLHGLEDLEVRECDSLETLFDVKGMMKSKEMLERQTSLLKKLTLSNLPKLKHIWNMDPHEIISFGSLREVNVIECQNLSNVFSLSQCYDLKHLEKLFIKCCGVEEIVALEEGFARINFKFPHLSILRLVRLEKLRTFYGGKHALLECPSLKILNIYHCETLQLFCFNDSDFQQSHEFKEFQDMPIPQPLFSIEKVSPQLEQLALNGKDAIMLFNGQCEKIIFPKVEFLRMQFINEPLNIVWNKLFEKFPNLVTLQVRSSYFETFPIETTKQVRKFWLFELEHLRHIWQGESPLHHLATQNLEDVSIVNCPSLISLVPSSVSFQSLKELYVDNCERLMYLITPSIAKSLTQLTTLIVKKCHKIEDVVKIDEEEEEAISFENLEIMELSSLSSLRSFCYGKLAFIFPSLIRFVVEECPQMNIFSSGTIIAPLLTNVEVENKRKWWKNDLNTTIEMLFLKKQEVTCSNKS